MKKRIVFLIAFALILLCTGCNRTAETASSFGESAVSSANSHESENEVSSGSTGETVSVTTSKEGVRKTLLKGGWTLCDSAEGAAMHGEDKKPDDRNGENPPEKPDDSAPGKKRHFQNSSIWFNNDGTLIFTADGQDINGTYEIKDDFSIDIQLSENSLFEKDILLNFILQNHNKYGIILYAEYKMEKLRYFMTMV